MGAVLAGRLTVMLLDWGAVLLVHDLAGVCDWKQDASSASCWVGKPLLVRHIRDETNNLQSLMPCPHVQGFAALRWWWEELALLEAFQSGRDDRTPAAKHIHDADLAQLDAHEAILDALAQLELRRP